MKAMSRPPRRDVRRAAVESTASSGHLKENITQRRAAEATLRRSGKRWAQLLVQSRRLQKHLQRLGREILSAQEEERRKLSHQLQDEIAQALCGIHVRLLALKKAATSNPVNLKKEIASTRDLVARSVLWVNRFARELQIHQRGERKQVVRILLRPREARLSPLSRDAQQEPVK